MTEATSDRVPRTLALPMDLTIAVAQTLQSQIQEAIAEGHGLVLDGHAVDRCDTAGLQLLLATQRFGAAHHQPVVITQPSAPLMQAAAVLGLAGALGLPHQEREHA